ncbi:MAG: hypothetical protein K8S55_08430 [Phycisphaerae bacterium]|nr:hypothetical protein [Phycisphaerae bacterium]
MAVDRPTFSESWYRVANLRPRLRSIVQSHRQHYRGQMWHVLQDPASNQFFRLNEPAYQFIGLLDGRKSVSDAWRTCSEQLGDQAPTQGEAIQLLGQLYTSNLLQAELPPDAEGLFQRYSKRKSREVRSYLMNLMFIRIPLIDPDHFLDRWVGVFGRIFTWYGTLLWMIFIGAGLYSIVGRFDELADRASGVLDPANLPLLYLGMAVVKVFHEFGHAFSCKRFGRLAGGAGEVHVMGIMFLVFTPMPYVDTSSAWAFRNKWHRIVVGAGGMFVELAIAAIAAVVWANTGQGTAVHGLCYNMMFIAGVSTLLFNGNPLLRYDAYYILSDLLEIPNLSQRSKEYLYYLVKRFVWGVRQARSPAHSRGERIWFTFYGIASTIYRVFICTAILLFIADKFFIVGAILAVVAVIMWVGVPVGKFLRYLATSGELARKRPRAILTTLIFFAALFVGVGLIKAPNRCRAEGIVEPVSMAVIYAEADGFMEDYLPSSRQVSPDGLPLLRCVNHDLKANYDLLLAERRKLLIRRRAAQTQEPAAVQIMNHQITALDEQIQRVERDIASLEPRSPIAGTWIAPQIDQAKGRYLHRGDPVGLVVNLRKMVIRAVADQQIAAMLISESQTDVEIRFKGRPDMQLSGKILRILPAGQQQLPSAALGYAAGGSMQTSMEDQKGTKAAERFFEILITPRENANVKPMLKLLSGQRVIVRFTMPDKPLALQWWRSLLQLIQRRFHI